MPIKIPRVRNLLTPRDSIRSSIKAIDRTLRRQWRNTWGRPGYPPEEPLLHAELFNIDQLERHAKSLAGWHRAGVDSTKRGGRGADKLLPRLAANEVVLQETYSLLTDAVARSREITPAAEWFLDNYHLIEEQIVTARRHLPRGYSRELPRLTSGPSRGFPRIYDVALELLSHLDGRIDLASVHAFVAAYQSGTTLRLGELWAVPIMLRLALLENLRRIALRVAAGRAERERAGYWIDRMLAVAAKDPAEVVLILAELIEEGRPQSNAFVAEFAHRVHGHGTAMIYPMAWLEQRLAEMGQTIDLVFQQSSQSQAADQVSIGNSIGSLRFLEATEWRDFVESLSVVEHTLRTDPAGVYSGMDFKTRDRYRHAIEDIANHCELTENEVAARAIQLTRQAASPLDESIFESASHVGYYLIDKGRPELESAVRLRPKLGQKVRRLAQRCPLALYAGAIAFTTAATTGTILALIPSGGMEAWAFAGFAVLLAIGVTQFAVGVVNWAVTLLVHPGILPRMDYSKGIASESRTVVAVPTMLTSAADIDDLIEDLEVRFLANRDENLLFALLSDFRDAAEENMPGDAALLSRAVKGIEELNSKYRSQLHGDMGAADGPGDMIPDTRSAKADGVFFLFHRPRRFNPRQGVWMGWERKRGKLEEFNAALHGRSDRFSTIAGPVERLRGVRFVITLDTDTQLPRDTARELAATMAHTLNRPYYDEKLGRVTRGYSILQPRVGVSMRSANHSRYARLFAGEPGIDPYTRSVSDVYQDVFGEGSFVGKGIYDVDTFDRAIGGRLPENRILSHDLLEGALARSGLVSDIVLFEEYPSSYAVDMSRRYRWIRGDWQILPWLLHWSAAVRVGKSRRAANPLSWLSQWKIADNLRRSMTPIALFGLLLIGWFTPGLALPCTLVVLGLLIVPGVMASVMEFVRRPREMDFRVHAFHVLYSQRRHLYQQLFGLACLPYEAWASLDAIVRTAVRVLITRRRLLEWRTAREAQQTSRTDLHGSYKAMWIAVFTATAAALLLAIDHRAALAVATPVLAAWLVAPAIVWWLSQPIRPVLIRLTGKDLVFLRIVARKTWRYFEDFVGPVDNDLPPDNFQQDPPVGLAHRTSPTNMGLALLGNLGAHDFGFITLGNLIDRSTRALNSMDKLRRYRGHFFNWYDTQTLEVLQPLYISTVDSGNLAGHLLTLAAGFDELSRTGLLRGVCPIGLSTTLETLAEVVRDDAASASPEVLAAIDRMRDALRDNPQTYSDMLKLLNGLLATVGELRTAVEDRPEGEPHAWACALDNQCGQAIEELERFAPWTALLSVAKPGWWRGGDARVRQMGELKQTLHGLDTPASPEAIVLIGRAAMPVIDRTLSALEPSSAALLRADDASHDDEITAWLMALRDAVHMGAGHAMQRLDALRLLAARCREMADMDYEFLYDRDCHLLATGFNLGEHRLDTGYYDLLASEARLACFVAIAQGKLPQDAWFYLGRQLTASGDRIALLSWSGSMFEYLMPLLVMPTYRRTLLDDTYCAIVTRQIEYGRERGVPWGISESAYSKVNGQLSYMYRAFGVPGLGFKRGLADELVVTPYATALALLVDPESACANLHRLSGEGYAGTHGFYEAIDYSASRLPPGETRVTVRSFMVHHQGMTLLALASLLLDKPMQRRFISDPSMKATELLLQERVPRTQVIHARIPDVSETHRAVTEAEAKLRVFNTAQTPSPEVHLLSNGRYHVALTAAGGGYSRWRDMAITRWREDPTCDNMGTFFYLRDLESGKVWSAAHQPTRKETPSYEVVFSEGRAEFRRRDNGIETHVEISVSPEDDVELRAISITNHGRHRRTIELTSYAEVVLATPSADAAHPAFSNLFVQTQLLPARQAILCTRRPRSSGERPPWMMHLMTVHGKIVGAATYETDRGRFLGRGGSVTDPAAMHHDSLGNSEGAVLDPIVAIRSTIIIEPNETVRVHMVTGITETRDEALALVERYHERSLADRVFDLAWTQGQVVLRQLDATEAEAQLYGRLAGGLLYANPQLRAPASAIARNYRGQSGLWAYGISGDVPIVLLRIADPAHMGLVRQMAKAHAYWRAKGLTTDLIIWNEDLSAYRQEVQDQIIIAISSGPGANLLDKPGGIFVRRIDQMSEEDKLLMLVVARVVIHDTDGTLSQQLDRRSGVAPSLPQFIPLAGRIAEQAHTAAQAPRRDLAMFNGLGGFTHDGREYVIVTTPDSVTPAPWVNVLANPWFGTVVSESGGAYTWCENAHSYRLTPWNNDPVGDAVGEAFYIRDEETGRYWSPSPLPARGPMPYTTRHGFGYTIFEYTQDKIATEMSTYVAMDAPIKFIVIRMRNDSGRPRRLSVTGLFELALGEHRPANTPYIVTEVDLKTGAVLARNSYNSEFGSRVTFLNSSEQHRTISGDRGEILGRNGTHAQPACMTRSRLSGRVGAGMDPCAAMQVIVDLPEHQEREIAFIFGSGRDLADAQHLLARFRGTGPARAALEGVWEFWKHTLGTVNVETPDPSLNFLTNGWLLYQVLACRLWARSGFYQSGGAFGFRDQLQDTISLIHTQPELLREQLLRAASRQFPQGDVQHWWHPPQGHGVRTRISDDYLWLPYATCRYITAMGDTGVLDEKVPFIEGRPLNADQESYYDLPTTSDISATLYEHCARAIRHGLRFGEHGLPLMGSGDWNDGMNHVGAQGRGESVWLAFFLYDVLLQFAGLANARHDTAFATTCVQEAATLRQNIERHAWDGEWYRRGFFDSGEPLGSSASTECQIDSLPQSWAILSGAGDTDRTRAALDAMDRRLVNRDLGLIQLFDPPFDQSDMNPGYIKGYPPGVRENGGQYTHAAVWAIMAVAAAGDNERAWDMFDLINPIRHGDSAAAIATYVVEPYVVAADVYTNPQHPGRGGWTWYTGSAGWMYRLITESLLGLNLEVATLRLAPCLPNAWRTFKIHYRFGETVYHITFHNGGGGRTVKRITLNGHELAATSIPLIDDRQHHNAEVEIE